MIVLLTTDFADPVASAALRLAVETSGITPDLVGDAYTDYGHKLNEWHVRSVPCLVRIHDGKAVDAIEDAGWLQGKKASTIKGRFTNAIKAHDDAKVEAENRRASAKAAERAALIKELADEVEAELAKRQAERGPSA